MYIEASSPRSPGDVALVSSPVFNANSGFCFNFFYHMYGSQIGTLEVLLVPQDGSAQKTLWKLSGEQANEWRAASVPVSNPSSYRVLRLSNNLFIEGLYAEVVYCVCYSMYFRLY